MSLDLDAILTGPHAVEGCIVLEESTYEALKAEVRRLRGENGALRIVYGVVSENDAMATAARAPDWRRIRGALRRAEDILATFAALEDAE